MRTPYKNIAIFGIAMLLSAGIFCVINGVSSANHQNMSGMSGLCTTEGGGTALCAINGAGHTSLLETISHVIPQKIGDYLLVLAFAFLLFTFGRRFVPHLKSFRAEPYLLYIKSSAVFSIFNPLRYAFSRGILHPQIYNSAYIS